MTSSTLCQLNQSKEMLQNVQQSQLPFHSSLRNSSKFLMQLRRKPFYHRRVFLLAGFHQMGIAALSHNEISNRIFTGSSETCLLNIQEKLIYSNQQ